jgi:acyl-CoA reductase-like NAD-dependent aldehyde dehydrogenase
MNKHPLYLAGKPVTPNQDLEVADRFSGEVFATVPLADAGMIDQAIAAAVAAAPDCAALTPDQRAGILEHLVDRFRERQDELAELLCREAGKPIKDSRGEVSRLIDTFRIAARETLNPQGEMLELQISPRARGYRGWTKRVPVGPCSFITPFNFPLNLVAHKVAPAIATGCPFVLKPDSRTPLGALVIGELLAETDWPAGGFSILPCEVSEADAFTTDERFKLLSFTGSPKVGWGLKARAGKKKVVLELGGNAACIVDEGADLDDAADRLITGAFYQSGQSCVGVQRILAHASVVEELQERLVKRIRELKSGNPLDDEVFIGPLIDEASAERVERWIREAEEAGGQLLVGGARDGSLVAPTLMRDVPLDQQLQREEVFGPVAVLDSFDGFDQALDRVNDSDFGIHAGVFTPRIDHAIRAWDRLEVGGVLINEIPSWRVDNLPYGGVKDSGFGREGIRYAMEDMTEIRALVIREGLSDT